MRKQVKATKKPGKDFYAKTEDERKKPSPAPRGKKPA